MKKILCICLSSTIQRTILFDSLTLTKVNRSKSYREDASGKAINSARVLNQIEKGCAIVLCPIGKENESQFVELAKKDDMALSYVTISGKTRECWTLLDTDKKTTTELVVSEPVLSSKEDLKNVEAMEIKFLKYLADILPTVDGVLLAGSKPGIWSKDLYPSIAGIVEDNNKFLLADFIGEDLVSTVETVVPDVIKINDEEFCKTFGYEYPISTQSLKEKIIEKCNELKNMIVITRGTESTIGASFVDGSVQIVEEKVKKVNALNTTACGDSFNAGFVYEYLSSGDFVKAIKKGGECASQNAQVMVPGGLLNRF